MDQNISEIYNQEVTSYTIRAEENENLRGFGGPIDGYLNKGFLAQVAEANNPPKTDIETTEEVESQEAETSYMEVLSSEGDLYARIPKDVFEFQDEETRAKYLDSVTALLDSMGGYFEFSKKYANASLFPIPGAPRFQSEWLSHQLGEYRANAVATTPYVHTPIEGEPEEYLFQQVNVNGKEVVVKCKRANLVEAIEVCSTDESVANSIDSHTIAVNIWFLGIMSQEYPIVIDGVTKTLKDIGNTFSTIEEVEAFVTRYLEDNKPPAKPAVKYTYPQI